MWKEITKNVLRQFLRAVEEDEVQIISSSNGAGLGLKSDLAT